ncbi:MAG: type II secretion system F family protein [Gammaproteobacteria bacterium]|nr:type II secretion system F family protein [Gammaproteobacteria bacterium]
MRFELKALSDERGVHVVALEASDEAEALRQARLQGYAVLTIRRKRARGGWLAKQRTRFSLTLFTQELLALLDAGLSIVEAIETLAEKEEHPETRKVLEQVTARLYEGHPLSYALQQFPAAFPALFVATVRASEKTSDLSTALSRYVSYQLQMDAVRKKVISASIYPMILLFGGGLVTLFLIGYVVPRFSLVYDQIGQNLPLLSRVLMQFGQILRENGLSIFIALGLGLAVLVYTVRQPKHRQWLVQQLWQIPAFGNRMKIYQLARFYRTLGMLLQGGTPIVTALHMASDLLQVSLRNRLALASASIGEGLSISQAMERHSLTTPVSSRMLAVGERSGRMGEMMDRIAAFYDDEMARWVERFSMLFEPILMAVIGLVIGVIVILMYFPIFDLAASIQ